MPQGEARAPFGLSTDEREAYRHSAQACVRRNQQLARLPPAGPFRHSSFHLPPRYPSLPHPTASSPCASWKGNLRSFRTPPLRPLTPLPPPYPTPPQPPADRFPLPRFLDGPVVRLVRKPLRIAFSLERLGLAVDADAALGTLRDFFERLAREFEAKR